MIKNIYEIFDEFQTASTKQDRINILRSNDSHHFKQLLKYAFDSQYEFYPTEFPKEYIQPDTFPGLRYAGIESELRRVYLFQKGNPTADSLSEQKRTQLLTQLLESFEPQEATIFVNMLKKNLQVPYLTKALVNEAFPGLVK